MRKITVETDRELPAKLARLKIGRQNNLELSFQGRTKITNDQARNRIMVTIVSVVVLILLAIGVAILVILLKPSKISIFKADLQ